MRPDNNPFKEFSFYMLKAIMLGGAVFLLTWDFKPRKTTLPSESNQRQLQRIDLVIMLSEITKNPDKVIIVDTRHIDYYTRGRISGAISFDSFNEGLSLETIATRYNFSQEVDHIIVYGNRSDPTTELLAMKLLEAGLDKIQFFYPGFEQWLVCGLPIEDDEA